MSTEETNENTEVENQNTTETTDENVNQNTEVENTETTTDDNSKTKEFIENTKKKETEEEETSDKNKTTEETEEEETFFNTGDASMDIALQYCKDNGIKKDSEAVLRAMEGDFSGLEEELQKNNAKNYDKYVNLLKDAYQREQTEADRKFNEGMKVVKDTVGGEKNWNNILNWVGEQGTKEQQDEIAQGLTSESNFVRKAVAESLQRLYMESSGTVKNEKKASKDSFSSANNNVPLTKEGYLQEFKELANRIGYNKLNGSLEYKQLREKYKNLK